MKCGKVRGTWMLLVCQAVRIKIELYPYTRPTHLPPNTHITQSNHVVRPPSQSGVLIFLTSQWAARIAVTRQNHPISEKSHLVTWPVPDQSDTAYDTHCPVGQVWWSRMLGGNRTRFVATHQVSRSAYYCSRHRTETVKVHTAMPTHSVLVSNCREHS